MSELESNFNRIKKGFKDASGTIVSLSVIIGAFIGIKTIIDLEIESKIRDEEFIGRVSRTIRPFVIFDSRSSVLHDQGAMDYIENIRVDTARSGEYLVVRSIVITPKQFLPTPPLLECIDLKYHTYQPKRGEKFDLIYQLMNENELGPDVIRFRLEILH